MKFLIDENVRSEVIQFFKDSGYDVLIVPSGFPDLVRGEPECLSPFKFLLISALSLCDNPRASQASANRKPQNALSNLRARREGLSGLSFMASFLSPLKWPIMGLN